MKVKKKEKNKSFTRTILKQIEDLLFQEYGDREKAERMAIRIVFLMIMELEKSLKKFPLDRRLF